MMTQSEFKGKSIILAVPNHFKLPQRLKENLMFLGFEVYLLQSDEQIILSLKDTLIYTFKKLVYKDKTYKQLVKNRKSKQKHLRLLSTIDKVDYALFIRPDLFDYEVVRVAKQRARKIVAYQWDGMKRYPLVKSYIPWFDQFYVFDKNDLKDFPQAKYTTNFYFDDITSEVPSVPNTVFFLGTYMKNRIPLLKQISSILTAYGLTPKFFLFTKRKRKRTTHIKLIYKKLSFEQSIRLEQRADYLLDLNNSIHSGLSFRTFESIGYDKKLITNNPEVCGFDFYNPNNIFVFDSHHFKNSVRLAHFFQTPYQPLDKEIKTKYSFTNWIKYILE